MALDSQLRGHGFDCQSFHFHVTTLDKLFTHICLSDNCMQMLDRHIWPSKMSLSTKLRLYNVYRYILSVFLFGAETWSITKAIEKRIDASDQCCLRHILNITWSEHVTNYEVRRRTGQPLLSDTTLCTPDALSYLATWPGQRSPKIISMLYKPAYRLLQGTGGGVQVVQDTPG